MPPHSNVIGHHLFHPHSFDHEFAINNNIGEKILEPYVEFNGVKIHHSIIAIICRILHRESLFLYRRQELQ